MENALLNLLKIIPSVTSEQVKENLDLHISGFNYLMGY